MNPTGLRKGFTTGTCAQAAAKGACLMLMRGEPLGSIEVFTPSGVSLRITLIDQEIGDDFARCAVIKDSGDDPDVTNGAKIRVEVKLSDKKGITIKGAEGVGKVAKPGLPVRTGEWAINPVPRRMIIDELSRFLSGEKRGFEVTISVPSGEELAKRTFNPRLGIVGGISILGTTGIVEPKSLDAYKVTLTLQLDVLKAQRYKRVILVLGYVGQMFCKDKLEVEEEAVIKIGDHVGFMLQECAKRKINEVLLIGHIGKLIKVSNGQFNTHYSFGDNRLESIAQYAKTCGAGRDTLEKILSCKTTEAAIPVLKESGLNKVFDMIAKDVSKKSMEFVDNEVIVKCILLSLSADILARTDKPYLSKRQVLGREKGSVG